MRSGYQSGTNSDPDPITSVRALLHFLLCCYYSPTKTHSLQGKCCLVSWWSSMCFLTWLYLLDLYSHHVHTHCNPTNNNIGKGTVHQFYNGTLLSTVYSKRVFFIVLIVSIDSWCNSAIKNGHL